MYLASIYPSQLRKVPDVLCVHVIWMVYETFRFCVILM